MPCRQRFNPGCALTAISAEHIDCKIGGTINAMHATQLSKATPRMTEDIELDSELGPGSRFRISIDINTPSAPGSSTVLTPALTTSLVVPPIPELEILHELAQQHRSRSIQELVEYHLQSPEEKT